MRKVIAALLGAVLIGSSMPGLVACGGDEEGANAKYKYSIKVWVGENTKELTQKLITDFNKTNPYSIWFNARVEEVTESKVTGDILKKPNDAPEIYCFGQDQLARLVSNKAIAEPYGTTVDELKAVHTASSIDAASLNGKLYAYPLTEDNGYFLYYDKRVMDATQVETVEDIMAACRAKNRYFSFNLKGGWYAASFFYAAGAKSEWDVDINGHFQDYTDNFETEYGMLGAKGLQKVIKDSSYLDLDTKETGKVTDFSEGTPAGAVVSGIWDYKAAKKILGDNLGIAPLPSFTVDGQTKKLASFLGCKLLGVSQYSDVAKSSALEFLAQYLTSEESQWKRFEEFGWRPSVETLQSEEDVKNHPALSALLETATVAQGQYPTDWWTKVQTLALGIKEAETGSEVGLQAALNQYKSELNGLKG
ncbi:MAG: extracellular solute-binding protein [Clostridiales bacterium]|nr:extracellular solute-binding protein [Clostridiales bacterium]